MSSISYYNILPINKQKVISSIPLKTFWNLFILGFSRRSSMTLYLLCNLRHITMIIDLHFSKNLEKNRRAKIINVKPPSIGRLTTSTRPSGSLEL